MTTLDQIVRYFHLSMNGQRMPIEIPNAGREHLADLFRVLGFKTGAEIGVERGAYSKVLCERNPGVHLYAVDAWRAYKGYRDHVTQDKLDKFYEETKTLLAPYHCDLVRQFSKEAVKGFPRASLDFVYIDANHEFKEVAHDVAHWADRVRLGGIVAGHDYCQRTNPLDQMHVVEVVRGYTDAWQIRPWFVLGTKAIVEGETRDRPRSFFWVKS